MQTYTICLAGPAVDDSRVPGTVARHVLDAVEHGARGAVRLRLEGQSVVKGPSPPWLKQASDFDLVSVIEGEAGLRLQAPSLSDALPDRFSQTEIFAPLDPAKTGLAFLSESLHEAVTGEADSNAYDDALLKIFYKGFGEVLRSGVERIELRNGHADSPVVVVTDQGLRRVEELHNSTPAPRRVRLAGWLDTIRYSDRAFTLKLDSGKTVRGLLADGAPELLTPHFGKLAVVSGVAHYRPSGSLLRIAAEKIAVGTEKDATSWGAVPEAPDEPLHSRQLRQHQTRRKGLAALVGLLEEELQDEDIAELISKVS